MDRADQIMRSRDAIREQLDLPDGVNSTTLTREVLNLGVGALLDLARIAAALERIAHHLENE